MTGFRAGSRANQGPWARPSPSVWAITLTVIAVLIWWVRTGEDTSASGQRPHGLPRPEVVASLASPPTLALTDAGLMAMQQASAQALAVQPPPVPLQGLVSQRPDYVSSLEWTLLQAVARQHLHPEAELTHLVNALRFNKQLERWQDAAASLPPAERQALAVSLIEELPARIRHGDMDLAGACQVLEDTLATLVPDAGARAMRRAAELQRLKAAEDQRVMTQVVHQ